MCPSTDLYGQCLLYLHFKPPPRRVWFAVWQYITLDVYEGVALALVAAYSDFSEVLAPLLRALLVADMALCAGQTQKRKGGTWWPYCRELLSTYVAECGHRTRLL